MTDIGAIVVCKLVDDNGGGVDVGKPFVVLTVGQKNRIEIFARLGYMWGRPTL